MCYNTRATRSIGELEDYYELERLLGEETDKDLELIYNSANGFAHPNMWIIPQEKPKNIIPVKWGLIPHYKMGADASEYYKETIRYGSGLNAKSEKLFSSNNYKGSSLTRRCVVPVDGFFEPHRIENVKKPFSVPFYFTRKDENPVHLAGIYAVTKDKMVTFTILTKEATPLFAKIHNKKHRRPVILQDDDVDVWLDETLNEEDVMNVIDDDMADQALDTWPISTDLYKRSAVPDRANIIDKVEYAELDIEY